jgi:uncharacterized membrane-anchored protein
VSSWKSKTLAAAGIVALAQSAVLGWIVSDRIGLLRHGKEIEMPAVPVDPRSLFRGDYVILGYPVSRVAANLVEAGPPLKRGDRVFVTIAPKPDGQWAVASASRARPQAIAAGAVVLDGHIEWVAGRAGEHAVRYGLEKYFVPEGKGRDLEKLVGDRKLSVIIVVGPDGRSAIKGLVVDGKRVYDEPLI